MLLSYSTIPLTHPAVTHFLVVYVTVVDRNSNSSSQTPYTTDEGTSVQRSNNKVERGGSSNHGDKERNLQIHRS